MASPESPTQPPSYRRQRFRLDIERFVATSSLLLATNKLNRFLESPLQFPVPPLIDSYAIDVGLPFGLYYGARMFLPGRLRESRFISSAASFALCAGVEVWQYFDKKAGIFDPYDFGAFAFGIAFAIGLERWAPLPHEIRAQAPN